MDTKTMTEENTLENFKNAAREDEYAEYELGDRNTLITDWEGDGYFNPYVHSEKAIEGSVNQEEYAEEVSELIPSCVRFHELEWDENNQVYHIVGAELRE